MCGIAGYFRFKFNLSNDICDQVDKMSASIRHRGPDDSGIEKIDERCILAHRRLSIVDLSKSGHQPMLSASRKNWIAFNGEIYNYKSLRNKLSNTKLKGTSDTEVFLELLSDFGVEETLAEVDGMFAFAFYDREKCILTLAVDQFGQKPLYYRKTNAGVFFSSDILSFINTGQTIIDRDALAEFFSKGSISSPNSLLSGVKKLEPGTIITFSRDGVFSRKSYFDVVAHINEIKLISPAEFGLDKVFESVVSDLLNADVDVGVFLSGGLDSSIIAAASKKIAGEGLKAFSFSFESTKHDEFEYANSVANHLGIKCYKLTATKENILETFKDMALYVAEPNADQAIIPTMLLSKLSRSACKVALVGDGGDELFDGYSAAHKKIYKQYRKSKLMPKFDLNSLIQNTRFLNPALQSAIARRLLAFDLVSTKSVCHFYERRYFANPFDESEVRIAKKLKYDFDRYENNLMLMDYHRYLPSQLLTKIDRASMAYSLELRAPYLSTRVVNEKIKTLGFGREERKFQYMLADKYFPAGYFKRPKKGFSVPMGDWLRTCLKDHCSDLLNTRADIDAYFDRAALRRRFELHLKGRDDSAFLYPVFQVIQLMDVHNLK
jgi:asparagine synthase (glutamine-hydrolysing)